MSTIPTPVPMPDPEYQLDEPAITAAAAVYSARLAALSDQHEDRARAHQERFDSLGLPRGLYRIEAA